VRLYLRSLYRTPAFLAFLGVCVLDGMIRRPQTLIERTRWMQRWSHRALRFLSIDVETVGTQPASGAMVCNHLSYLDIMVLGAQRPTVMVGKTELQGWPLIGSITTRGGTFFLDRSSKISAASVAEQIAQAVDAGIFFLFFPEGTSSEGTKILPFHSPLFQPIVEAEAPIYPAHLTYLLPSEEGGKEAVGTKVCYWGDASIVTHLPRLLGLRGLHCSLRIGADAILAGDRKSAAMQSRIAVEKLFAASLQQAASVEHLQHLLHTPIERVGPLNGEGSVLARR